MCHINYDRQINRNKNISMYTVLGPPAEEAAEVELIFVNAFALAHS